MAPPETVRDWPTGAASDFGLGQFFGALDKRAASVAEPLFPAATRKRAIDAAVAFVTERLNGEDGLGAIYPAMANSRDDVRRARLSARPSRSRRPRARRSRSCWSSRTDEAYCQPCVSPVWDTALVVPRAAGGGAAPAREGADAGLEWLQAAAGARRRGRLGRAAAATCGPAAGRSNTPTPLSRSRRHRRRGDGDGPGANGARRARPSQTRSRAAREWIEGLQSRNGGWGAFDADNTYYYLNNIPFADHGALLDPPTADVTARCVSMLAQLGETRERARRLRDGLAFSVASKRRTAAGSAAGA